MTIDKLRSLKIGLVLSGGGAKGAYEIGCWKAMRNLGITISAVAGTSVGALNAALVATDDFDIGLQLWNRLRVYRVIGLRVARLALVPLWLLCSLFRLAVVPIRGGTPEFRLGARVHLLWMAVFLLFVPSELRWGYPSWFLDLGALVCILSAFGPLVKAIVLKWGFTSNSPLQGQVDATFTDERLSELRIPAFATLAVFRPRLAAARHWDGWVPLYIRLNELEPAAIRSVLLQSAGIPGLFPVRSILGHEAIDGGWCDNVPAAPLLFDLKEKLDLLVVIYLSEAERRPRFNRGLSLNPTPYTIDVGTGLLDLRSEAEQKWHIHELAQVPGREHEFPFDLMYTKERAGGQLPHIVSVVPSKELGNFLTGTLNFSKRKARKLIRMGEDDMRSVIAELVNQSWENFRSESRMLRHTNASSELWGMFRAKGESRSH